MQRKAAGLMEGLECIPCEESVRTRGLSSLENTRLRNNLIALYSFPRKEDRVGGADLYSLISDDRICGGMAQNWRCSGQIVVIL